MVSKSDRELSLQIEIIFDEPAKNIEKNIFEWLTGLKIIIPFNPHTY